MKTNKRGISLIVLTITIIVMIILASAIILSLSGKNVIATAKEAVSASDMANVKHVVAVAKGEWQLGEVEGDFESYAESKLQEAGFKVSGNGGIKVSKVGAVSKIYQDAAGYTALVPEGYIASEVTGENTIADGLVIYEGYEPVTDRNAKEAQITRNQFVWIPVDPIGNFARKNWNGLSISGTTSYNMNDTTEIDEYAAMYNSVNENGGFYIARYEAGKEETDTVVSKKNATIWRADWKNAKVNSESLSNESMVAHLVYGEEWDAALKFISKTDSTYPTNSAGKGNYDGTYATLTGTNDNYKVNNIYDMAGNVAEWTMERQDDNGLHICRALSTSAGYRYNYGNDSASIGFRIALYLK